MSRSTNRSISQQSSESLLTEAVALIHHSQNEMAEKRLTVVLNSDHSSRSHIVKALLLRGVIRCETGNVEKGLADWRTVLVIDPHNSHALKRISALDNARISRSPHRRRESRFGSTLSPNASRIASTFKRRPETNASLQMPYELWLDIALYLPRSSLRPWLLTSRIHRAVALPFVFERIRLQVGQISVRETLRALPDMKKLAAMSKEILERICVDEQFAGFIKSMVVVAMSASVMKSLYGKLLNALPKLRSLTSFAWEFGLPDMGREVASILTYSAPLLRNLSIGGEKFEGLGTQKIKNLSSFEVDGFKDSRNLQEEISGILRGNYASLRVLELRARLSLGAILHPEAPLENLQHICLSSIKILDRNPLDALFTRATRLRSLILDISIGPNLAVSAVFIYHFKALPLLEYLTLSIDCGVNFDFGLYNAVARFISNRPKLTRLRLEDAGGEWPWQTIEVAGESLAGLEVLRVDTRRLMVERIEDAIYALPKTLQVVYLAASEMESDLASIAALLKAQTRLEMLSIHGLLDLPRNYRYSGSADHGLIHHARAAATAGTQIWNVLPKLRYIGVGGILFESYTNIPKFRKVYSVHERALHEWRDPCVGDVRRERWDRAPMEWAARDS